ncbi:hypothetical protein L198_00578 [Cryptococcus wingfieldii CBS 7118]|uniref:Seipin n=1 Tax=Cryptococcus wingfieldii CBS 7118 TaxID=1295528 RepID=A0A1E3K771_9TREE|nr:hypothetical protein L198_00578 [Cryptococcus wingfieldii CBS 7118]ODO08845.1 hypothetical protein L198_00578 [Cryptococcus wingfieldii CBS 7118]
MPPPRDHRFSQADLDKRYYRRSLGTDFLDFLIALIRLSVTPITFSIRIMRQAVTSPVTVSLIIKVVLALFLAFASAIFSVLVVGAFFWSWSAGGPIEVEGWLFYGSKSHRLPHVTIPIPPKRLIEDLRYDVQVEMELVRPTNGADETDNFMLSLELRGAADPSLVLFSAAQPSLAPGPLATSLLPLPAFPTHLAPPCVIPWPFRSFCPSRLIGYGDTVDKKTRQRRLKAGFVGSARARNVVSLNKNLMEGVVLKPNGPHGPGVGSAFVSIGREDAFADGTGSLRGREIKTTGWIIVRLIPRPAGIRWLITTYPLPPLILLPPISLALTLTSSLGACVMISFFRRPKRHVKTRAKPSRRPLEEKGSPGERDIQRLVEDGKEKKKQGEAERKQWDELERRKLLDEPETATGTESVTSSSFVASETETATVIDLTQSDDEVRDDSSSRTATEGESEI